MKVKVYCFIDNLNSLNYQNNQSNVAKYIENISKNICNMNVNIASKCCCYLQAFNSFRENVLKYNPRSRPNFSFISNFLWEYQRFQEISNFKFKDSPVVVNDKFNLVFQSIIMGLKNEEVINFKMKKYYHYQ